MEEKYIAAIDLGTSKIALTVAKAMGDDIQIIYYKETPSDGIRNSYVFNPMKAAGPLRQAIDQAEQELRIKILQAVVGLPRYAVRQVTANARLPRTDSDAGITREEVENLKSMAVEQYPIDDPKKEIMYGAVAQSFSTDDSFNHVESDIIGMPSETIEGNFKVFIGAKRQATNIDSVFNSINVAVARKYFTPDVVAKAVLYDEEMDNGVALIDFGAGATSVTIYSRKVMRHYASIPFGGKVITTDIKSEATVTEHLAENIKLAYGACMPERLQTLGEKSLQIVDENRVPQQILPVKYLSEIITSRVREIINAILYEIQESGYADSLRSGVVLTGGCANLVGCAAFIKELSGYNVRIGYPRHKFSASGCQGILETSATACAGMVLAAKNDHIVSCIEEPLAWTDESAVETGETVPEEAESYASYETETQEEAAPADTAASETAYEPQPDGTLFDTSDFIVPKEEKKERKKDKKKDREKKEPSIIWNFISKKARNIVDSMGDLYENMSDEQI